MEHDKLYVWEYYLHTQKLERSTFDIDISYKGMYDPNDYIKVLHTDTYDNKDYTLINVDEIDISIELTNQGNGPSSLVLKSFSDDPNYAMKVFDGRFYCADFEKRGSEKCQLDYLYLL